MARRDLRDRERVAGDSQALLRRGAFGVDLRGSDPEGDEPGALPGQLRVERVEAEHHAARPPGQVGVLL